MPDLLSLPPELLDRIVVLGMPTKINCYNDFLAFIHPYTASKQLEDVATRAFFNQHVLHVAQFDLIGSIADWIDPRLHLAYHVPLLGSLYRAEHFSYIVGAGLRSSKFLAHVQYLKIHLAISDRACGASTIEELRTIARNLRDIKGISITMEADGYRGRERYIIDLDEIWRRVERLEKRLGRKIVKRLTLM